MHDIALACLEGIVDGKPAALALFLFRKVLENLIDQKGIVVVVLVLALFADVQSINELGDDGALGASFLVCFADSSFFSAFVSLPAALGNDPMGFLAVGDEEDLETGRRATEGDAAGDQAGPSAP